MERALTNGIEESAAFIALDEVLARTGLNGDIGDNLDVAPAAVFALERYHCDVSGVEEAAVGIEDAFINADGAAVPLRGF